MTSNKTAAGEYLQIVVSLPRKNGLQIKDMLKKVADENSRSLANLIVMILSTWLKDNGYEVDKIEKSKKTGPTTHFDTWERSRTVG